jgi:hypothetical protein
VQRLAEALGAAAAAGGHWSAPDFLGRGAALGGAGSSSRGSSGAGALDMGGLSSSSPILGSTPSEAGSQLLGQLGRSSPAGPGSGGAAAQAVPPGGARGGALGAPPLSPGGSTAASGHSLSGAEGLPFMSLSSAGSGSLSPLPGTRNLLHGLLAAEGGSGSLASPAVAGGSGLLGSGIQGMGQGMGQQGLRQGMGQGMGHSTVQGFSSFDLLQQGQGQGQGQVQVHAQQHNGSAGTFRGYGLSSPVSAAPQLLPSNGLQQQHHLHQQHQQYGQQQVMVGKAGLQAMGLLVVQGDVTGGYGAAMPAAPLGGYMRY